jgi:adenylate kinase
MSMLDDDRLEAEVRDLLMDICEAMSRRKYELVNVGALMRLVGVGEEKARVHDDEYFALDADFQQMLAERNAQRQSKNNKKKALLKTSTGATLH